MIRMRVPCVAILFLMIIFIQHASCSPEYETHSTHDRCNFGNKRADSLPYYGRSSATAAADVQLYGSSIGERGGGIYPKDYEPSEGYQSEDNAPLTHDFSVDFGKPDFYNPNYGFSKETVAAARYVHNDENGENRERQFQYGDSNQRQIEKRTKKINTATQVNYNAKQPQTYRQDTRYQSEDSKPSASDLNPFKYLSGYEGEGKYDEPEVPHRDRDGEQARKYYPEENFSEYNKYLREVFRDQKVKFDQDYAKALRGNYKDKESERGEDFANFFRQAGGDAFRPSRPEIPKFPSEDSQRYFAEDFVEKKPTFKEYYDKLKSNAEYEFPGGFGDEFNSLKFREGDRSRFRNRRPPVDTPPGRQGRGTGGPRGRSPRPQNCSGNRCGGRPRRPLF